MIKRLLHKASSIKDNEVKATVLSFLFIFFLMMAHYIMRPVRDAMASDWTDTEVSKLLTLNFLISTVIVALYGLAVSKIKFKYLVPGVYTFFAIVFVVFYALMHSGADSLEIDKAFFIWISVFGMFHLSVFLEFYVRCF